MNVFIVYCHPSKNSYTFDILTQLKLALDNEEINYQISDLYEMNFKSDMSAEEYKREGFGNHNLSIQKDVLLEQQKIEKADCIVFLYPVWWSDCPAKLKGWFDRVYSVGYAYGYHYKDYSQKMKNIKFGLVVCTAGHSNELLKEMGISESMRKVMIDDRLGKRFINKEMIILGGTLDKIKVREKHAQIIRKLPELISNYCSNDIR